MARQYSLIQMSDFGSGIDQQSAESRIPPGFIERAFNADPLPAGQLRTRKGYEGYAGNLPVRVTKLEYKTVDDLCFTLDTSVELNSVDLSAVRSTPIIVKGKALVDDGGDFPSLTESVQYYDRFTADARKTIPTGLNNIELTNEEHGLNTDLLWTGITESLSDFNKSNQVFYAQQTTINQSTFTITHQVDNNTLSSFRSFIYTKKKTTQAGVTYNHTITIPATSVTITQATHQLINNNIIVKCFDDDGTSYTEIIPNSVTLDPVTGQVDIDFGYSFTGNVSLSSVSVSNKVEGFSPSAGVVRVTIPISAGEEFIFPACYIDTGSVYEQVLPDLVDVDTENSLITIDFLNNSPLGAAQFLVIYEFGEVRTNVLCVTSNTSANDIFTDTSPQIVIYGLDHSEIYGPNREPAAGWVTHLDNYRSEIEEFTVSGLGGGLFRHSTDTAGLLLPTLYPNIRNRAAADTVIGPAIYDNSDSPTRTAGFIQADDSADNMLSVQSIQWDTDNDVTVILSAPGLAYTGTPINTTLDYEDLLTIEQAGYNVHNGEFKIKSVSYDTLNEQITLTIINLNVDSADFDDLDSGARAGVFTDRLSLQSNSQLLPGDNLLSQAFTSDVSLTALYAINTTLVLNNVIKQISVPAGLTIVGERTNSVIPLRTSSLVASVENVVRGDMIAYSEQLRPLRVLAVNPESDITISSIVGTSNNATVTITGATTQEFRAGQKIIIKNSAKFTGTHLILDILNGTQLVIDSTIAETDNTGQIMGKTIQVDEELEHSDNASSLNVFTVPARWQSIERPSSIYDLPVKTYEKYFDTNLYTQQTIIRSTMSGDNMYLANGVDELHKFDGVSLYQAGLPRFESDCFIMPDYSSTGKIVLPSFQKRVAISATLDNRATVTNGAANTFSAGTVVYTDLGQRLIVRSIDPDGHHIFLNANITGSPAELIESMQYSYYAKINLIDINGNITNTAVLGSQDLRVELYDNAAIKLKFINLPVFGNYDYDRLELQLYRTKANGTLYYLVTSLPLIFDNNQPYVEYTDTLIDDLLTDPDSVNFAQTQDVSVLNTTINQLPLAQHVTSAGNRLLLGNLSSLARLDIRFNKNPLIGQLEASDIAGYQFLLRKDNTDTDTNTDNVNRFKYEFSTSLEDIAISQGAGQFEVTFINPHNKAAGDWVQIIIDSPSLLPYAGWWQVYEVTGPDSFSIQSANAAAGGGASACFATSPSDIPVYIGEDVAFGQRNGNLSGNNIAPLAVRRLAKAINASMRAVNKNLHPDFLPFVYANASSELAPGQLILRQPYATSLFFELVLPDFDPSLVQVFGNEVDADPLEQIGSIKRGFKSRLLISYPNYPEVFDQADSVNDNDSVLDINSDDGQEITGLIPFFGDSAFGAAQKSGVVVVFKTNSIYLVDVNTKQIQKLESQGKGCTAPYSIAPTKDGIMFANESGIYKLTRNMSIEYVGQKYERVWRGELNKQTLYLAAGTHDPVENQYKLSYCLPDSVEPTDVAVYNHTREQLNIGQGGWTTYDNHPALMWANLNNQRFFASTTGRVFKIRDTNLKYDYRDDNQAINLDIILPSTDFGAAGIRKYVRSLQIDYRSTARSTGTVISTAVDTSNVYQNCDASIVSGPDELFGLSQDESFKIFTIKYTPADKFGKFFQARITNSSKDEPLEIASVQFEVAGISPEGIREASKTTS